VKIFILRQTAGLKKQHPGYLIASAIEKGNLSTEDV
jgi:hypothetical protein